MRAKRVILVVLLTTLLSFNILNIKAETVTPDYYWLDLYAFGTDITYQVSKHDPNANQENIQTYFQELEDLTYKISDLTDNFYGFEGINNVYYINNNVGKKIEIDKLLYDIIKLAEEYKVLTDGYFDISIGKIVDKWKDIINSLTPITESELNQRINVIKQIPVIENGILLSEENNKYYIEIKDGVKIDLGAIAKGYMVELVDEYFKSKNLKYYRIMGSDSSLKYGENYYREGNFYHIEIYNPLISDKYGYVKIKNTSITTSGDTYQQDIIGGRRIHHIISPKTKMPETHNRLITIIHDNAALSDALSTALFSMDNKTLAKWAKDHGVNNYFKFGEGKNGEVKVLDGIEFVYFEVPSDNVENAFTKWIVLAGVVIVVAAGLYIVSSKKSNINKNKEE